jgi:hypothetical protein
MSAKPSSNQKNREKAMSDLAHCLAILKALGVSEVRYCLSGGGDSGTTELEQVLYLDGRHGLLPPVTVAVSNCGGIVCLDERLEGLVSDVPDGDWVNNEGGYGHVVLRPQESDPDLQVECDMTYGEEGGDPDFEDDEDCGASDFNETDPDTSGEPIAVDDSTLHPTKGETP